MDDSDRLQTALKRFAFLSLFALAVTVFMGKPEETSLQALDSTTHATIALEVSKGGILPVLPMQNLSTNLRPGGRFNDHPFPLFYLSGKIMRALGPEAWTARLLPCLFSAGCVLLLALLGAVLYTPASGLVAGIILLLSRDFILIGSRFHLDTPMIFFILLSFFLWIRNMPFWAGIAAGLGLWMKTPVTFLLYPSVFFALLLTGKLSRKEFSTLTKSAMVAIATGSLVWIATGAIGGWDLVLDYWKRQVWGTAVGGRGGGAVDPWMLPGRLKASFLPWLVLLLASLGGIVLKKRWNRAEVALPFSAALITGLVISAIRFKFYWYFLPIFPFLALLCVDPLAGFLERKKIAVYSALIALGLAVPSFLLAVPVPLGPENFPALRKFEPFIQSYGTAADRVFFVDGGQKFGGDLDHLYELQFYTGRSILQGDCKTSDELILRHRPEWVFGSGANLSLCLKESTRALYPVSYRYGGQHLLSRIIPRDQATDLTPLRLELKAPLDGVPVALPHDPYFVPAE